MLSDKCLVNESQCYLHAVMLVLDERHLFVRIQQLVEAHLRSATLQWEGLRLHLTTLLWDEPRLHLRTFLLEGPRLHLTTLLWDEPRLHLRTFLSEEPRLHLMTLLWDEPRLHLRTFLSEEPRLSVLMPQCDELLMLAFVSGSVVWLLICYNVCERFDGLLYNIIQYTIYNTNTIYLILGAVIHRKQWDREFTGVSMSCLWEVR